MLAWWCGLWDGDGKERSRSLEKVCSYDASRCKFELFSDSLALSWINSMARQKIRTMCAQAKQTRTAHSLLEVSRALVPTCLGIPEDLSKSARNTCGAQDEDSIIEMRRLFCDCKHHMHTFPLLLITAFPSTKIKTDRIIHLLAD